MNIPESPTLGTLLRKGNTVLKSAGVEPAHLEARLLLEYAACCSGTEIIVRPDRKVNKEVLEEFSSCVEQRCRRIPLSYITGRHEFMSLDFIVTPEVLIPRPETEILVEQVIESFKEKEQLSGLDIGTGSGCIPVSLAKYFKGEISFMGCDISPKAITVARMNSIIHGVQENIEFMVSDIFGSLNGNGPFDVITANLPYIPSKDINELMPEVKDHEPVTALNGGEDGLSLIRTFVDSAWGFMKPGGLFFIEIGIHQSKEVVSIISAGEKYGSVTVIKDYSGIDRVIKGERK